MSIRSKIILIMVPLIVCVLVVTSTISSLTTKAGLERLAISSFSFKSNQFERYINEQWSLLVQNGLSADQDFIMAFQDSLLQYAKSVAENEEIIFAFNEDTSEIIFTTSEEYQDIKKEELEILQAKIKEQSQKKIAENNLDVGEEILPRSWVKGRFNISNLSLVGYYFTFPQRNMIIVVTTTYASFTRPIREIIVSTALLILMSLVISVILIFRFSKTLIGPLRSMVSSMQRIIENHSFDERVQVIYQDEVGELSQTFNVMVEELDNAYKQIKQYAFSAVLAQKNERKIRHIFQKYVPARIIDDLFQNPTRLLAGENRKLAVMFTDIRSFTTIAESYEPDELVRVLNEYFERLVEIITSEEGIIDKYIGDAIMCFFGAPSELENSPLNAVRAALNMVKTLNIFNADLKKQGKHPFVTGIGINYGLVTVGNIGSEKKMDYTVIGDAVNLGSRLEGLTKEYKQDMIFSTSVKEAVHATYPCRVVDIVQVKGKTIGEIIYSTNPDLTANQKKAYQYHNKGFDLYLKRSFAEAFKYFSHVQELIKKDFLSQMFMDRCKEYIAHPPEKNWNGVSIKIAK